MHNYYDEKIRQFTNVPDGHDFEDNELLAVNETGIPIKKIKAEAMYQDVQAFWSFHEKKLLLIIAGCCCYLIFIIM